jgi:hypothetical protein
LLLVEFVLVPCIWVEIVPVVHYIPRKAGRQKQDRNEWVPRVWRIPRSLYIKDKMHQPQINKFVRRCHGNHLFQDANCPTWSMIAFILRSIVNFHSLTYPNVIVLTTILPILFQYCYKYCYSDSRNLWAVMKAGGLAL